MTLSIDECNFLFSAMEGDLKAIRELTTREKRGYLLRKQAKVPIEKHDRIKDNEYGCTALGLASRRGHLEVIRYLIANNVNVNGKNKNGSTALHWASWNGQLDAMKCLIASGAEVNQQNDTGHTSLHYASRGGQLTAVEVLLERGADPRIRDSDNKTAIDYALEINHNDITNTILQFIDNSPGTTQNLDNQIATPKVERMPTNQPASTPQPPPIKPNHQQPTCNDHDEPHSLIQSSRDLLQSAINHPESSDNISNIPPDYILQFTDNFANLIGEGACGQVYLAKDPKLTTPKFAVKVFDLSGIVNANHKKQIIHGYKKEAAILKRFKHPNIIGLYGTCNLSQNDDKFALVMEYANKGSLASFLKDDANRARLTADIRISIMFQLARSIHFLHTGGCGGLKKILHRDIKPSNICLTNNYQVKLIDCGLAKLEEDPNAGASQLRSMTSSLFASGYYGPTGTRGYRCPIYELTNEYEEGSDVFSLGVVFAELIIGCLQGRQARRNGKVFGFMYDTFVWDRLKNRAVDDGCEKLSKDADMAIVWNPNLLKTISKLAIECMAPTLERRKVTLDLVSDLNQILGQALLETTTTAAVMHSNHGPDDAAIAVLNAALEYQDAPDASTHVTPCWLCNRNLAGKLKCSEGHAFCVPCACELVARHLNAGSSSLGCCVLGCECKPFGDKDLFCALPFEIYQKYTIQKSHVDFMHKILYRLGSFESKMESVHQDVKDNKDMLRGISNKLTRSVMALGALTVKGAKLCPNLVWMVPTKTLFKTNPVQWFQQHTVSQTYKVVFICQHSWEVTHKPFKITVPRQWVAKVAPLLKFGLLVLKAAAEVHDLPFPDLDMKAFDKRIQAMEKFVDSVVQEDDADIRVLMSNASEWVRGQQQGNHGGNEVSSFSNSKLSNLLGQGLDMIRETAYRAENLTLWTEQIIPVPLQEESVDSFGVKWVKKKYRGLYYS